MNRKDHCEELERRIAQTRRLVSDVFDPTTTERLNRLIEDLEQKLRESNQGRPG
jgi:hypothetical protein